MVGPVNIVVILCLAEYPHTQSLWLCWWVKWKNGHAAQRNLLSFSTFEGLAFKLFRLPRTTKALFYFAFLSSYPPPSLHLPQLSPTHLSLWCFCGWEAVTKGTGCHCHHGDGLHRASQLLSGTINKHQSLVNISPAAQSGNLAHGARVHRRCITWRGGGRQKGTGSRQDGNNSAETRERQRGDDEMRWVRQQTGGGSEKDRSEVHKPQCSSERQEVYHLVWVYGIILRNVFWF